MEQIRQLISELLWEDLNKSAPRFSAFTSKKVDPTIKSHINSVIASKDGKKYKFHQILKTVITNFGVKITKILGQGSSGIAFLTIDNKVLKITTDPAEYQAMRKLMEINSVHFPKIYKTYIIDVAEQKRLYVILKEHIYHNKKYEETIKNLIKVYSFFAIEYNSETFPVMPTHYTGLVSVILSKRFSFDSLNGFYNFIRNYEKVSKAKDAKRILLWFLKETVELCRELIEMGISTNDIHAGNIGIKNKHLVYFDVATQWDETIKHVGDADFSINELITSLDEDFNNKTAPKYSAFTSKALQTGQKKYGQNKIGWGSQLLLHKALKTIIQYLGIKVTKYLGGGEYGHAFLTNDNKVLKLTTDAQEVNAYLRIQNANSIHLPRIYKITKVKVPKPGLRRLKINGPPEQPASYMYAILKDYTFHNRKYFAVIKNLWSEYEQYAVEFKPEMELAYRKEIDSTDYEKIMPLDMHNLIIVALRGDITRESLSLKTFNKFITNEGGSKSLIWFTNEIISLCDDLRELGIREDDIHAGNIGIMNKHLVYFDPRVEDEEEELEPELTMGQPFQAKMKFEEVIKDI